VIAADVFVRHVGEVSFGNTGSERRERAQALVDRLYPEFQPRLRAFIDADPLRALRRQADLERLRHSAMPRRLFLRDAPGADSVAGAQAILLRPHGEAYVELRWCNPGEEFAAWFHLATEWNRLAQVLGAMGAVELRPGGAPSDAGLEAGTLRLYPPEPAQAAGPAGSPAADPWAGRAAAAEERVRTLEASRSWRITAPLRAIGRWLRPRA
jgi:hypothetical protein